MGFCDYPQSFPKKALSERNRQNNQPLHQNAPMKRLILLPICWK